MEERLEPLAKHCRAHVHGWNHLVRHTMIGGDAFKFEKRTSVLFVSISFVILMVISLAWLIFYYVQRFRYLQ